MTINKDLIFFKEERLVEDFFRIHGYQTGADKFKILLQEGFLKKSNEGYILTEIGKNQLTKFSREEIYIKFKTILEKTRAILRKKHQLEDKKINAVDGQRLVISNSLSKLKRVRHIIIDEFNKISEDVKFKVHETSLHSL